MAAGVCADSVIKGCADSVITGCADSVIKTYLRCLSSLGHRYRPVPRSPALKRDLQYLADL
jgi:hypothetical protein